MRRPQERMRITVVPTGGRRAQGSGWVWTVAALSSMTLLWMITAGAWIDEMGGPLTVVTWDGHHVAVTVATLGSLVALAVLAALTKGFAEATQLQSALVAVACFVALVAMAGVFALLLPVILLAVVIRLIS
jgi:hypothetical protein